MLHKSKNHGERVQHQPSVFQKSAKSRQKLGDKLDKLNSSYLKNEGESLSHTIHGTGMDWYIYQHLPWKRNYSKSS